VIKDTLVVGDLGFIGQKVREKLDCLGMDLKRGENISFHTPIRGIKYVIHCAGQPSVPFSRKCPVHDLVSNVVNTLELIRLYPNAKFTFLSSINVLNLDSPYAVSKQAAECYLNILTKKPLILRITNVIDKDHGIIAELANSNPIVVYGDRKKDFIQVDKVVNFICGNYKWEKGTHVVGSGKLTSIKSVAERIAEKMNKKIIYKDIKCIQ